MPYMPVRLSFYLTSFMAMRTLIHLTESPRFRTCFPRLGKTPIRLSQFFVLRRTHCRSEHGIVTSEIAFALTSMTCFRCHRSWR